MSDIHAAIDIGTNSIHLVVARATASGGFEVVTSEKEMVRLGSGAGDMKRLEPAAIDRGIAALSHMVEVATSLGADITAVATSAVREAENRQEFVDRARCELGLVVEVISGIEEARLIHHGALHAIPSSDRRTLVVDIGGGSTEFVVGDGLDIIEARSLRLGAIRITQRFVTDSLDDDGVPTRKAIKRCRVFLRDAVGGVARDLGAHNPETIIGCSGTITSVAEMIAARRGPIPKQMNGVWFSKSELDDLVDEVISASAEARGSMPGLDERRIDIIVGGILLLQEILRAFDLDDVTISEYALREGVLFDRFPAEDGHLYDLRRSNAVRLARQLDPDSEHAETAARLAIEIFDQSSAVHKLGADARELLEIAALVHNVGMVIAHSGHHKHAHYVIRNSERLTGFSEHETELVALIARYHRKSHPAVKHPEFAALGKADRRLVSILAGILRVAIGLDRRHANLVSTVEVELSDDPPRLIVKPIVPGGEKVRVEVFAARARSALLGEALETEIVIDQPPY